MSIIRWSNQKGNVDVKAGGFGMVSHNYDGDMLTDELAQVHKSPGFITSCISGKSVDGLPIKLFESSHGTVTDMWQAKLRGEETSINPIGMVEGLIRAIEFSNSLWNKDSSDQSSDKVVDFTDRLRKALYGSFKEEKGTRDLFGKDGLTTEQFIDHVGKQLE